MDACDDLAIIDNIQLFVCRENVCSH